MIALFDYCFNRSALHKAYIQRVAEVWNKNGVKTFNDLDTYYEKQGLSKKDIIKTIAKNNNVLKDVIYKQFI